MALCEGGGNCLKYLKRGGTERRGGKTKILKKGGGQAGSRGGCLRKGGGLWNPLTNYRNISLDRELQVLFMSWKIRVYINHMVYVTSCAFKLSSRMPKRCYS